jgi:hypothetical protein
MTQNEFDAEVKRIRTDNGIEFKNTQVENYLDDEGIKHEFSAHYTPQQNGVAERKNRTLIEMARTMLDEYKTSDQFWVEAVNTACHATNRLYLHKLLKKTPYELLIGNKSNVFYFKVFVSKCYILQKRSKFSNFTPKVYEDFLLGYDSNSHAYHVFNKDSSCVESTCDTVFDEINGSQLKQYDLDVVDDEEASCGALQRMAIRDVRPQDPSEPQAPNDTTPSTQDHEEDQEDEQDEDQAHDQEESIDHGGDKDDGLNIPLVMSALPSRPETAMVISSPIVEPLNNISSSATAVTEPPRGGVRCQDQLELFSVKREHNQHT